MLNIKTTNMTYRQKRPLAGRVFAPTERARALYRKTHDSPAQPLTASAPGVVAENARNRFIIRDNFAARSTCLSSTIFHRFDFKEIKSSQSISQRHQQRT